MVLCSCISRIHHSSRSTIGRSTVDPVHRFFSSFFAPPNVFCINNVRTDAGLTLNTIHKKKKKKCQFQVAFVTATSSFLQKNVCPPFLSVMPVDSQSLIRAGGLGSRTMKTREEKRSLFLNCLPLWRMNKREGGRVVQE